MTIPTVISKVRDMFIGCIHLEHVYFYGAKPFEHWGQDRHVSFAPNEKTLFHVLHGTANAWKDAYQVEEEGLIWRANCTFVDDLGTDGNEILIYHEGDWANLQDMVDMGFTNISAKLMNLFDRDQEKSFQWHFRWQRTHIKRLHPQLCRCRRCLQKHQRGHHQELACHR